MKKLLVLSACLWALGSSPVLAQTSTPAVAVVRLSEQLAGRLLITVSRGAGQTEAKTDSSFPLNPSKSQVQYAEAYQQAVASMLQQGYTLKGVSGGDNLTTLFFIKEK